MVVRNRGFAIERLDELIDDYQLSPGSMNYSLDEMHGIVERMGLSKLAELIAWAKEKQQRSLLFNSRWKQQQKEDPLKRPGTKKLDNRIDRLLSKLVQGAEVFADLEIDTDEARLAEEFLDDLFSEGVYPITSQPFEDQHAEVNLYLERLDGEYAEHVEALNLGPVVDRLAELNAELGDKLNPDAERLEYSEVEAAYTEARDAFHRVIVNVMAEFDDDMETFNEVYAPIHEQHERARRHLERRGSVPEVDPETGEPVDEETPQNDGETPEEDGEPPQNDGEPRNDDEN